MSSKLENKFIAKSISKLYLHSHTADVQFVFEVNDSIVKLPAHKNILAAASPVFDKMFFGPMKEKDIVEIKDASAHVFEEFLQFFYLPEVTLTMENIEEVARLADKYDMMDDLNACAEFVESQLTKDNMIWGYQLAISLNNTKLKQFCEKQIQLLTKDAFVSDIFLHCEQTTVEQILRLDSLRCNGVDLFNACIDWAKISCQKDGLDETCPKNIKNQLGEGFYWIPFGAMTTEEIGLIISNELHEKMFSRDELRDWFCLKTVDNFQSNILKHTQHRPLEWDIKENVVCYLGGWNMYKVGLQARESTWFSTNIPLLLSKIECIRIHQDYGYDFYIDCKIAIYKYNDQSFGSNMKTEYEGTVKFSRVCCIPSVTLTEPIVIHPKFFYEIRLDTSSNISDLYHSTEWKSHVKLDIHTTIKIHRHPTERSNRRGSASALHFNRI